MIQNFMMAIEIKMATPCHFPLQFPETTVAEAEIAEVRVIPAVRAQPVISKVVQENDMSSRWSCEKFAEASLMRLRCSQFSLDVIIDVFSTFIVEKLR